MVVWRRGGKERAVWKCLSIGTAEVLVVVAMSLLDGDERDKSEMSDESRECRCWCGQKVEVVTAKVSSLC